MIKKVLSSMLVRDVYTIIARVVVGRKTVL